MDEIAAKIKAAGKTRKILLDLRDVSDGDADQGLRLANFFINQGTLATLEGQKFPRQTFTADPAKFLTSAPVAVLVNRGTYGAAELAADAIEDAKRGDVVGERTFGEGSVQKTIELPDGAALLLTVAKYEGPDGKKIQDEAVAPTVVVGQNTDDDIDADSPQPKRRRDAEQGACAAEGQKQLASSESQKAVLSLNSSHPAVSFRTNGAPTSFSFGVVSEESALFF